MNKETNGAQTTGKHAVSAPKPRNGEMIDHVFVEVPEWQDG
jgi:hypothetical protein